MKLIVFLGLVILLVSSPVGMSSAQMYWEGSGETDTTITAKDFQAKVPGRPLTTPRVKMYDDYEVLDIEPEQAPQQTAPRAVTAARTRPGFTSEPPRSTTTAPPPAAGPRRPGTTKAEPSQSITDKPRPVMSAPGKGPKSEGGATREDTQTQTLGRTEPTSPPATKKMPWGQGQVDVKPAEPEEEKLKWGEQ